MLKPILYSAVFTLANIGVTCSALAQSADVPPKLDCSTGPVAKTFGAAPWLVFACSDETSLVVVSAPGNAGNPFFFKVFVKDGERHVVGEGTGSEKITPVAYQELVKLTEADIAALIAAAKEVPKGADK